MNNGKHSICTGCLREIISQIQEVVIIIPAAAPTDDNLMLLLVLALVLGHGVQKLLELVFGDLLSQLAALGEHEQPALDVGSAGFLDEADAAQAIGGFGFEDLVQDGGAAFG